MKTAITNHDAMNVLIFSARIVDVELAFEFVGHLWAAEFTNKERHIRRAGEIAEVLIISVSE